MIEEDLHLMKHGMDKMWYQLPKNKRDNHPGVIGKFKNKI
jgi:hypothetical protein